MKPRQKELITAQLNAYLGVRCGVTLDKEHGVCLVDPATGEVIPPGSRKYPHILSLLRKECPAEVEYDYYWNVVT